MGILIVLTCSELLDVTAALCEHQRGRAQILAAEQQQSSGVSTATKAGGMMNDLGSADIRVGFILGGFFYSRFVQERGLKPRRTHTHTHTNHFWKARLAHLDPQQENLRMGSGGRREGKRRDPERAEEHGGEIWG